MVRFYDPAFARQPNLYATNLRLAGTEPRLVLRNTSNSAINAQARFLSMGETDASPIELPPLSLASKMVDLTTLRSATERPEFARVSVEVRNEGPAGSLIGHLIATAIATGLTYDVPLRDSGPVRQSTGSYPWRIDGDHSSVVSVTNVGPLPAILLARIVHPTGTYWIRARAVGASATFDLRAMRDEQIPDRDGAPLPRTVDRGQLRWSIIDRTGTGRFVGRNEVVSRSRGLTSSYSCGQCCPDSYNAGFLRPGPISTAVGSFTSFTVIEQTRDCTGQISGEWDAWASSWWVEYASITSASTTGWGTAQADGLGEGESLIEGRWTSYIYSSRLQQVVSLNGEGNLSQRSERGPRPRPRVDPQVLL